MPFGKGKLGILQRTENTAASSSDNFNVSNGKRKRLCLFLKRNLLLMLLIVSLFIGIGLGILLRSQYSNLNKRTIMLIRFPGELLLRMLKCLVIPLIVSSLISGIAAMDTKSSGRMGLYALIYYITTTFLAVIVGIILVSTIRPGNRSRVATPVQTSTENAQIMESFLDLIRNIFPDNIFEATFRQTKTKFNYKKNLKTGTQQVNFSECYNVTNNNCTEIVYYNETEVNISLAKEDGVNALGLVCYSLVLGVVLGGLGEMGKPLLNVCQSLAEATMKMVTLVIWYSPVGIVFLICAEILSMENPLADLQALGWYMLVVLLGLFIHSLFTLPLVYFVVVRRNPFVPLASVLQAFITAFGTASSSATLPVTYYCLEEKLHVDNRVTRFVLPVGATMNMDGTALYEAVAAIFIAQLNDISLNMAQVVAVSITATLASIGAASVPQAGLVTMVIVLSAVGLPAEEVTKILAIDWLLDRFRTTVNVQGDVIGCLVVNHLCRHQLERSVANDKLDRRVATNVSFLQQSDGSVANDKLDRRVATDVSFRRRSDGSVANDKLDRRVATDVSFLQLSDTSVANEALNETDLSDNAQEETKFNGDKDDVNKIKRNVANGGYY